MAIIISGGVQLIGGMQAFSGPAPSTTTTTSTTPTATTTTTTPTTTSPTSHMTSQATAGIS